MRLIITGFASVVLAATGINPIGTAWADVLYVSSWRGNVIDQVASDGTVTTFANSDPFPQGVAFDKNGNLHVALLDADGVDTISPTGQYIKFTPVDYEHTGMAFDAHGNLFVSTLSAFDGDSEVDKIDPSGHITTFIGGLTDPEGLTFDAGGNLVIALGQLNEVLKVSPAGKIVDTLTGLSEPSDVVFDKSGNLYVSSFSYVIKVTPNGTYYNFAQLSYGWGMAFDSSGYLYVGNHDSLHPILSRVAPDGTVTPFATIPGAPAFIADRSVMLPIPEPSTGVLSAFGFVLLAWRFRRYGQH